jgi:hypothetical protein
MELANPTKNTEISMEAVGLGTARDIWQWE